MVKKTIGWIVIIAVAMIMFSVFDPSWRLLASEFATNEAGESIRDAETIHIGRPETLAPMGNESSTRIRQELAHRNVRQVEQSTLTQWRGVALRR